MQSQEIQDEEAVVKVYDGGQLLVDSLLALGAKKAFGVPGESYLPVLNALHDTRGRFDYVLCRQEGGASFMAAAYGKLTGQPGICLVTRGPGATNAAIGVHTARQDSAPMLLLVGQVDSAFRDREAFQELDYRAVFGDLAKWATEIDRVGRIPEILARAWHLALSGRPGPVVISLPEDILESTAQVAPLSAAITIHESEPGEAAIQEARAILTAARHPVILYGGCNWHPDAMRALQGFAEQSDIPVVSVFRYVDQFNNHSPAFCGEAGVGMLEHVRTLLREADVVLAVNNRFGENSTAGYTLFDVPQPRQQIIHVHGSDLEIGKIYLPRLAIHAGPNAFAHALARAGAVHGDWAEWRAQARRDYESSFQLDALPSPVDMGVVCTWLREHLPPDVIVTNGAGNFTAWPNKFLQYGADARLLAPQSGAMGYGLPAAIAAKVAQPQRMVVCFAGDGDFQMNITELGTALQAGAQPIVLLLNNGIYGTIRAHQERRYPTRVIGTTMEHNPDFVALARAYGFHAERVGSTDEFPAAFGRAQRSATGAVLELNISPEALTPRKTLSEIRQSALHAQEHH